MRCKHFLLLCGLPFRLFNVIFFKTTKSLLGLLEIFFLGFCFLPATAPEIGNYCEKETSYMLKASYIFAKSLAFFPSSVP